MSKLKPKINIKEIFWDYNFTQTEIEEILNGDDFQKKKFLFEKILLNSKNMILELSHFNRVDLLLLLENFQPGNFNREYALRRIAMAETYFFDKPMLLPEFQWRE